MSCAIALLTITAAVIGGAFVLVVLPIVIALVGRPNPPPPPIGWMDRALFGEQARCWHCGGIPDSCLARDDNAYCHLAHPRP